MSQISMKTEVEILFTKVPKEFLGKLQAFSYFAPKTNREVAPCTSLNFPLGKNPYNQFSCQNESAGFRQTWRPQTILQRICFDARYEKWQSLFGLCHWFKSICFVLATLVRSYFRSQTSLSFLMEVETRPGAHIDSIRIHRTLELTAISKRNL